MLCACVLYLLPIRRPCSVCFMRRQITSALRVELSSSVPHPDSRILRLLRHAFNLPWTKLQVTDILFSYRLYAEISRTSYVTISRFLNNRIQYGSHLQSPEGWRIQWKDEVSLTAHMNVILLLLRPSDPRGGGTVCEFCSYYLL